MQSLIVLALLSLVLQTATGFHLTSQERSSIRSLHERELVNTQCTPMPFRTLPESRGRPVRFIGSCPAVISPIPAAIAKRFSIDTTFYSKYIEAAGGIPVISSSKVSNAALIQMAMTVNTLLAKNGEAANHMANMGMKVGVMARYPMELTTDVPEHAFFKVADENVDGTCYWNERSRGLGAMCYNNAKIVTAAEENILCDKEDRYVDNAINMHELAHGFHNFGIQKTSMDIATRLYGQYLKVKDTTPYAGTYAGENENEFWAETSVSFLGGKDSGKSSGESSPDTWTRADLKALYPDLFSLMMEAYGSDAGIKCPTKTQTWATTFNDEVVIDCTDFWRGATKRSVPYSQKVLDCDLPLGCSGSDETKYPDFIVNGKCPKTWSCYSAMNECMKQTSAPSSYCQKFFDLQFPASGAAATCPIPSDAPSYSEVACPDTNASCFQWASTGECKVNPAYMLESCKASCAKFGFPVSCRTITTSKTAPPVATTLPPMVTQTQTKVISIVPSVPASENVASVGDGGGFDVTKFVNENKIILAAGGAGGLVFLILASVGTIYCRKWRRSGKYMVKKPVLQFTDIGAFSRV